MGKFSLGKWDLGHWDWDLVTGNGNHRQKNNRTGTGIFKIWKNNTLGNGIWAKFGLGKWDLYPPPLQDPLTRLTQTSLLSHMIIVMLDETCLATNLLLTNPTGEAFNLA